MNRKARLVILRIRGKGLQKSLSQQDPELLITKLEILRFRPSMKPEALGAALLKTGIDQNNKSV